MTTQSEHHHKIIDYLCSPQQPDRNNFNVYPDAFEAPISSTSRQTINGHLWRAVRANGGRRAPRPSVEVTRALSARRVIGDVLKAHRAERGPYKYGDRRASGLPVRSEAENEEDETHQERSISGHGKSASTHSRRGRSS